MASKRKAADSSPSTNKSARKSLDNAPKLGKKIAQVYARKDKEPHTVHHNLICASFDFFAKALNGEFRGKNGEVRLPEQNSENFALYVQWLCTRNLQTVVVEGDGRNGEQLVPQVLGSGYFLLESLYVMGVALQDESFQNEILDTLMARVGSTSFYPVVLVAFKDLPPNSPLRKLFFDFWVYAAGTRWPGDEYSHKFPGEVLYEVTKGLLGKTKPVQSGSWAWKVNPCQYHVHTKDNSKCV